MHFEIRLIAIVLLVVVVLLILLFDRRQRRPLHLEEECCDPPVVPEPTVCQFVEGVEYLTSPILGDPNVPIQGTCNLPTGYITTGFNTATDCTLTSFQLVGHEVLEDDTLGPDAETTCFGTTVASPTIFLDTSQPIISFSFTSANFEFAQIFDSVTGTTAFGEEFTYEPPSNCGQPFNPMSSSFTMPPGYGIIGFNYATVLGYLVSISFNYAPLTSGCADLLEGFPIL